MEFTQRTILLMLGLLTNQDECLPRCANVTLSGECLQCQDSRFYGKQCENDCPDSCLNSRCQLNVSRVVCTEGCVAGKKGDNCKVTCSTSCRKCERYGDGCIGPCSSSQYYGDQCQIPCQSNCIDGCDRDTGACEICKPGYRGKYCNVTCPSDCTDGCDKDSGVCGGFSNTTRNNGKVTGIIMVTLAVVLCLVFTGFVIWFRRNKKTRRYKTVSTTVHLQNEMNECRDNNNIGDWDFDNAIYVQSSGVRAVPRVKLCAELKGERAEYHMAQEFKALPEPKIQTSDRARLLENSSKNRYKDILPFDNTRVCLVLEDKGDNDYINASYIDGYRQTTKMIAAQGPTEPLLEDFWSMIWQTEVPKIVMLSNLVEGGTVKCEKYWPSCDIDYTTYGDVSVQCVEERVFGHHTIRSLAVWKKSCETRIIKHFHYTSWPAQGVPDEVTSLIDFYKVVTFTNTDEDGPTLVHCSAGVGRTGTFLSLVHLIEQARSEARACVYTCVHDIRFQRMMMVHTEEQYTFLYRVLIGALQTRGILQDNSVPVWLQCRLCWETDRQPPEGNDASLLNSEAKYTDSRMEASPV